MVLVLFPWKFIVQVLPDSHEQARSATQSISHTVPDPVHVIGHKLVQWRVQ